MSLNGGWDLVNQQGLTNKKPVFIDPPLKNKPHPQNLWADSGSGRPPIV
jgi:hypothetical protein